MERVADLFWHCWGLHRAVEKGLAACRRLRYGGGAGVSEQGLPSRPCSDLLDSQLGLKPESFQLSTCSSSLKHVQMYKSEDGVESAILAEASG